MTEYYQVPVELLQHIHLELDDIQTEEITLYGNSHHQCRWRKTNKLDGLGWVHTKDCILYRIREILSYGKTEEIDWTSTRADGVNHSMLFNKMVRNVYQLITINPYGAIGGNQGINLARRIVSVVAHGWHMVPTVDTYTDLLILNKQEDWNE